MRSITESCDESARQGDGRRGRGPMRGSGTRVRPLPRKRPYTGHALPHLYPCPPLFTCRTQSWPGSTAPSPPPLPLQVLAPAHVQCHGDGPPRRTRCRKELHGVLERGEGGAAGGMEKGWGGSA